MGGVYVSARRRILFAVSVVIVVTVGTNTPRAFAQSLHPMHRSPHHEESANIVGLKGGAIGVFSDGEATPGASLSPFYERNLIEGWLELEGALVFSWAGEETIIGIDVFAKKPFHVNEVINPYAGLGPNVSFIIRPEETVTRFGLLATVGSYFWFGGGDWAFDIEVVYLLLFDNSLTHELAVEIGPAFRF